MQQKGLVPKRFKGLVVMSVHVTFERKPLVLRHQRELAEGSTCGLLTHEEVQHDHVYEIHQPGAVVVGGCLLHCVTVAWLLLPPGGQQVNRENSHVIFVVCVVIIKQVPCSACHWSTLIK